ncbi:MAG: hypothetical protein P1P84_22720 [Deferrisomatales bacterium]|nr:hypothetical protein [Deferrisomatales bacterium]
MESLLELYELISERTFIPIALSLLLAVTVGTGMLRNRLPRVLVLVTLGLAGVALYFGLGRHEWGEVLFNGQLL